MSEKITPSCLGDKCVVLNTTRYAELSRKIAEHCMVARKQIGEDRPPIRKCYGDEWPVVLGRSIEDPILGAPGAEVIDLTTVSTAEQAVPITIS